MLVDFFAVIHGFGELDALEFVGPFLFGVALVAFFELVEFPDHRVVSMVCGNGIAEREECLTGGSGVSDRVHGLQEHLGVFVELGRGDEGFDDLGVFRFEEGFGNADGVGANER